MNECMGRLPRGNYFPRSVPLSLSFLPGTSHIFLTILVNRQMHRAKRPPANLLLDKILIDAMLRRAIVLRIRVFRPRIQRFLDAAGRRRSPLVVPQRGVVRGEGAASVVALLAMELRVVVVGVGGGGRVGVRVFDGGRAAVDARGGHVQRDMLRGEDAGDGGLVGAGEDRRLLHRGGEGSGRALCMYVCMFGRMDGGMYVLQAGRATTRKEGKELMQWKKKREHAIAGATPVVRS